MNGLSRVSMVCLGACLALISGSQLVWGQAGTSTVRGGIVDPQRKLIPGANVTLKNAATNFSRTQVTGETGSFSFELIPPGDYSLEVEVAGFRKKVLNKVQALVRSPTDVTVQMEIGQLNQVDPIRQRDFYASSDFDIRHVINVNGIFQLPFGRGRMLGSRVCGAWDALIGGWQISSIYRWNTGLTGQCADRRCALGYELDAQSYAVLTRPLSPCVTKGTASSAPKLFGCDPTYAYQSFRNPYPGESGMRNVFRLPGYTTLDLGLSKSFNLPWNENHKLQLRWEVFNVTNTQRFGALDLSRSGYGIRLDPAVRNLTPPTNWSNFTGIQGAPRVMQIGARIQF